MRRRSDKYSQCDQLLLCNLKTDLYKYASKLSHEAFQAYYYRSLDSGAIIWRINK